MLIDETNSLYYRQTQLGGCYQSRYFFLSGSLKSLSTPMETEEDLVARILAFGGTVHNTLGIFERLRENIARNSSACN